MLSAARGRLGLTLVELLVGLVLLGLTGAAILRLAVSQTHFHVALTRRIEARRALRESIDLLRTELRGVAPADGGIVVAEPERLDVRSPLGFTVICAIDSTRTVVSIPPRLPGAGLTSWIAAPEVGDTLLVYASADHPDSARWHAHVLSAPLRRGGACPVAGGLVASPAESAAVLALHLAPPLASAVAPGAVMRVVRRTSYQLYRSGDGRWYLGVRDCLATRAEPCGALQPVTGPLATDGLQIAYRDSSGAAVDDPRRVVRLDITLRARSPTLFVIGGRPLDSLVDSITAPLTFRNP
jgi:type II secretory pathway pseudopilin PulG